MRKKNENIVGVIPLKFSTNFFEKKEKKVAPQKRKRGLATMYWQPLVKIWFDLYAELIPAPPGEEKAKPCFDTVETAQMKIILKELRKRAEDRDLEWTEEEAKKRWEAFLRYAWTDDWISKNFMLRIISTNKTKIFNQQITPKKNGKKFSGNIGNRVEPDIKPASKFGEL